MSAFSVVVSGDWGRFGSIVMLSAMGLVLVFSSLIVTSNFSVMVVLSALLGASVVDIVCGAMFLSSAATGTFGTLSGFIVMASNSYSTVVVAMVLMEVVLISPISGLPAVGL